MTKHEKKRKKNLKKCTKNPYQDSSHVLNKKVFSFLLLKTWIMTARSFKNDRKEMDK